MSTALAPGKLRRVIEHNKRQMTLASALGVPAKDIGKLLNRAAPTAPPNGNGDLSFAVPDNPDDLVMLMSDNGKMREILQKGQLGAVVKKYAENLAKADRDIKTQVRDQVQAALVEFQRQQGADENVGTLPLGLRADGSPANAEYSRMGLYNRKAMGATLDGTFENAADYFRTIWHNAQRTPDVADKLSKVRNAFSSTVPSEGGFLIPETLRSEMLRMSLETALVRPRARVIPMETLRVPFPAIDSTSNASSVYGGIVAYWTEEAATLTASEPTFSRIVLEAKKLTAYTEIPNELIADSPASFNALIESIYPEALGWYEDDAFINGNGVGMPLGMLNANNTALIDVALQSGQTSSQVVWEQVIRMFARMLPASIGRGIWLASPAVFVELATMALTVGTGGSAIWLNNGVGGPPATILGRPLYFSEKIPNLGTVGDLAFIDPSFYLIGDRQVMSAMSSPHYKFGSDQTAYRIISRVDGTPWVRSAITPKNGGDTLSPFVRRGVS